MDLKRFHANQTRSLGRMPQANIQISTDSVDRFTLNKMLFIRFKLMNFVNNFHDSICNQVSASGAL